MEIKPEQRLTVEQVGEAEKLVSNVLKAHVVEYEDDDGEAKKKLSDYGNGYKDGFAEFFAVCPILPEGMKAAAIINRSEAAALLEE